MTCKTESQMSLWQLLPDVCYTAGSRTFQSVVRNSALEQLMQHKWTADAS
jgi:hypothetical protein